MMFMEWLHAQAQRDPSREQPFSGLYEIGPLLTSTIGESQPKVRDVKAALDAELDDPQRVTRHLGQLVEAIALWKTDMLLSDTSALDRRPSTEMLPPPEDFERGLTGVLPPVVCGYRSITGAQCENFAVPGAVRCGRHGGAITDPEVRSSLLLLAYSKLVENTDVAVEALLDVARNSRTDMARVQAAKELLDRAGIVVDSHIHVHDSSGDEADRGEFVDRLKSQLGTTKDRLRLVAIPASAEESG